MVRARVDTKEINKVWYSSIKEEEKQLGKKGEGLVRSFLERLEKRGLLGVRHEGKFYCLHCFYYSFPELQINKEDIIGPRDVKEGGDYPICWMCKKPLKLEEVK